ncbi:MAG: hypothetical protein ACE5JD_06695 [Candidatus Methylomirabilia bacterium]
MGAIRMEASGGVTTMLANEFTLGKAAAQSGESLEGAGRFRAGAGRHGQF